MCNVCTDAGEGIAVGAALAGFLVCCSFCNACVCIFVLWRKKRAQGYYYTIGKTAGNVSYVVQHAHTLGVCVPYIAGNFCRRIFLRILQTLSFAKIFSANIMLYYIVLCLYIEDKITHAKFSCKIPILRLS